MTYDLLASSVLTSSASSVTFSSISQDYRDLIVVINAIGVGAIRLRYNGDTDANFYNVRMLGNGSTATSTSSNNSFNEVGVATSEGSVSVFQVLDYTATDKQKSSISRSNSSSGAYAHAHRWANTAAVTEIQIYGTTYSAGSTFYLYGVAA